MSKPETSPDNGSSYGSLIKWTLAAAAVGIVGGVVVRSLLRCSSDKPALKPTKMKEKAKKPQKEIDGMINACAILTISLNTIGN